MGYPGTDRCRDGYDLTPESGARGARSNQDVIITVDNIRPVAHAGADQLLVTVRQTVQLNGSGSSDADGDALSFRWALTTRPAGSQATLTSSTLVNPSFVADVLGTYVAQLIVNDGTATAADIRALIETARTAVHQRFGVELLDEVVYLGTF